MGGRNIVLYTCKQIHTPHMGIIVLHIEMTILSLDLHFIIHASHDLRFDLQDVDGDWFVQDGNKFL
jgi:hypothetical protein